MLPSLTGTNMLATSRTCHFATAVFATLLFSAISARGDEKPSWQWSIDDRLEVRLAPASVRERFAARSEFEPKASEQVRARVHSGDVVFNQFVIDGERNPELFLPWELMDSLLGAVGGDAEQQKAVRQSYSASLARFGWSEASFWLDMDRFGAAYAAARDQSIDRQRQLLAPGKVGASSSQREIAHLNRELCTSRAEALRAARLKFGPVVFDRF